MAASRIIEQDDLAGLRSAQAERLKPIGTYSWAVRFNCVAAVDGAYLLPLTHSMTTGGHHPVIGGQPIEHGHAIVAVRTQAHHSSLQAAVLVQPPHIGLAVFGGNRRQRYRQWDQPRSQ